MNNFTQSFFTFCRNSFKKSLSLAVLLTLLVSGLSYGQTDDFTDGNFTASPAWSGNTGAFTVETATPYVSGGATTDGFYLASDITTGNVTLSTPSTEVNEWKFSLGTGSFSPSATNYFGVILMSNIAVSGSIAGTSWNGYYLKIGIAGTTDPIELWVKNGAGTGTKVGDFPTSPNYDAAALLAGLNIRVTRSATGVFQLFYSTGFTYGATPTTSAGTLTNNTVTTSSFFGVYSVFANPSAARRLFLDNVVLGTPPVAITSAQSGNWSSTTTWVGGVVPTSADNVIIATSHVVTLDTTTGGINTRNSGVTTTVDSGGTLATSVQYINNGTTTINGTFQLNAGGFTNSGNNFVYAASNSFLVFNSNTPYGVNNADQYWPTTNSPFNVIIIQGGMILNAGANRTVAGTFQTVAPVTLNASLTVNGVARINTGGSFVSAPIYGSASILVYNTATTYARGIEWSATSGTVGVTPGYPNNVTVTGTTTLNFANGSSSTFLANGVVTIDPGSSLFQNFSGGNAGLTVGSNVVVNGNMTLGTSSGDLALGGNLTVGAAANFSTNGRAVLFTAATGNQTITRTGGGVVDFDYLVINKAAGNVVLSSSPATNATINAAAGDVLQLLNSGELDLNGRTLTLNNNGGNIAANGAARSITSSVAGATLAITGTKLFSGAGTLVINTNVTTILSSGFDFGSSKVTINGILQLNLGGFAPNGSAPIYASGSTLLFNTGGNYDLHNGALDVAGWFRNVASTGTAQAGVPWNVTISNNTSVRYNMLNTDIFPRYINGNLIINAGSSFTLGGLTGTAGDFFLRGNWTNSGTFNPNTRLVNFNGTTAQTLTGATTFDFLTLSNGTGLTLASPVTVNQTLALTSGKITIGANNLTVAGTITGQSATNYVATNSNGQLRQTVGASAIIFPVGNTAYNPITFTNSGTSDSYGVRVVDAAPTAAINSTKTVSRQWITTEAVAGGSNLAVVAQYNTGETGGSFGAATTNYIGFYNGSTWIQAQATSAGTNPITVSSNSNIVSPNLTSGTQYFAIGKDNAFLSVATKFVITSITPASPGAGYGFTVTVQAQDDFGATPNVIGNTSFTLSTNGNAGAIGGTTTGTILAGSNSVIVSGVILPTAGTGVTLTATRTSGDNLIAGTSSSFNVLAAASQLAFGVAPPATGFVGVNLTSFTVEARRQDASVDTFYTGNITIAKVSGTGTLTGTLTVAAVAGVATFTTAQFDAASTYTLIASALNLTSITSGNIVINLAPTVIAQFDFTPFTLPTADDVSFKDTNVSVTDFGISAGMLSVGVTSGTVFPNPPYVAGTGGYNATTQAASKNFNFTINANIGYKIEVTSFQFNSLATSAGPSAISFNIASGASLFTANAPDTVLLPVNQTVTGVSNLTSIPVLIQGWLNGSRTSAGSGNFRVDDVIVKGYVTCIQPTAYAVTGGGTGCTSTGVTVGLANSQIGISYHLKNGATTVGAAVPGTGSAISFGAQTTAGTYTVEATNTNGTCNLTTTMTGSAVVTLDPTSVAGTVSLNQAICSGSQPADITLSGNTGTIQWQSSTNNSTFNNISGQTSATLSGTTIGALTATTYYRAIVTSGSCPAATSATVTITVSPTSFAGTVSGNQTICFGSQPADITLSGSVGAIQWQSSTNNTTFTDISGQTAATLSGTTIGVITATTYYRAIVTSGTCPAATSATVTITVSPTSVAGTVSLNQAICSGSQPADITLAGSIGTIQWQSSTDNSTFNNISGQTSATLSGATVGALTATTYYRAIVTSGSCAAATSTAVTITVSTTSVAGTVSADQAFCSGTQPTDITLAGSTGAIQWQSSTNNTTFTDISGQTAATLSGTTIGPLTVTTYYRAVVTSGSCPAATSPTVTITVSPTSVAGTVSANQAICSGSEPADITLSGSTGTIQWQTSADNSTFVNIGGQTSATLSGATIGAITATTYYRAIVTSGSCAAATSATVTVLIETTTWTSALGGSWDNGTPTSAKSAVISFNYAVPANLSACTLTVNNNAVVTIPSGFNVTLNGQLNVISGSSFTLSNNANLIQSTDVANAGNIIVKRNSSALKRQDYTLWSSPVAGQNLLNFSPLTLTNRFYTYETNATPTPNVYVAVPSPSSTSFAAGKGYLIRMPNNHPTFATVYTGTFTGIPNNGPVPATLTNAGAGLRFNAVGNPYPSTIDMASFVAANRQTGDERITGTLYFWRKTNNVLTTPGYCTWTAGTFVSNGEAQVFNPNGIIQVGQGFIVEAQGTATQLNFNNTMRVANNNNQFFKSSAAAAVVPTETNRIWLNMTSPAGEFSQTAVGYMTNATQGVDAYDGKFFNEGQIAISSYLEATDYAIQGRALPFEPSDVVPLNVKVTTAGSYSIAIDHVDGLFATGTQDILLKDNLNGTYTNLNSGSYTFTTAAGTFNNRFELVYQTALSNVNPILSESNVIVYKQNSNFVINTGIATMASVKAYDMRGRLLMEKNNINASETQLNLGTTNQVVLLQITSTDGLVVTKKVVN